MERMRPDNTGLTLNDQGLGMKKTRPSSHREGGNGLRPVSIARGPWSTFLSARVGPITEQAHLAASDLARPVASALTACCLFIQPAEESLWKPIFSTLRILDRPGGVETASLASGQLQALSGAVLRHRTPSLVGPALSSLSGAVTADRRPLALRRRSTRVRPLRRLPDACNPVAAYVPLGARCHLCRPACAECEWPRPHIGGNGNRR